MAQLVAPLTFDVGDGRQTYTRLLQLIQEIAPLRPAKAH